MLEKTPPPIDQLDPVTPAQVDRARQACATHALDALDLAYLLDVVGIGPDWQEQWRGPVAQAS